MCIKYGQLYIQLLDMFYKLIVFSKIKYDTCLCFPKYFMPILLYLQIKKKNDVIRGLQADLRQIQKFSEDHIRRVKLEAEKQENTDKKNSEGRKQRLQQEITQLNTQLQSLTLENRESEQELRRVSMGHIIFRSSLDKHPVNTSFPW